MIDELKLVNRQTINFDSTGGYTFGLLQDLNQTPFQSSADIEIDDDGQFLVCQNYDGIEQVILKAILTSSQLNGYGTDAYALLGKKNLTFIKGRLMTDIVESLNTVKSAQLKFLSENPTLNQKTIIAIILNVKVDKIGPTKIQSTINVQTLYDQILNKNNTKSIVSVT